ncbi:MAG: GAF domain-containing protein [Proteobacteria bacterium]|nr:GAF domain-containing protein [Pseudomonadota bacterium]
MKETPKRALIKVDTTLRFFLVTLISVFIIETLIMLLLPRLHLMSAFWEAVIDGSLLVLALFPLLYYLSFRTLMLNNLKVKQYNEKLEQNQQTQETINSILDLSLQAISLEEHLDRTLDHILSLPWLSFEQRACIFLVEDKPDMLIMKIHKGLPEDILRTCSKVPFGRCICGRAAKTNEIIFADRIDDRHEIRYEGISSHGHYCFPISAGGRVLGVLNLYVKEGHKENEVEIEFLSSITAVLAETIERKRAEKELKKNINELEQFNRLSVGREKRMIELKSEINTLLHTMGKEERYMLHGHEKQDDGK